MKHLIASLLLMTAASAAPAMGPWQQTPHKTPQNAAHSSCHLDQPCALGARSYHVMEPEGWDGRTPLPVLVHFHGWGRNGVHAQKSDRIGASTQRRGVLLVTPNGRRNTWDFWGGDLEDVQFTNQVLQDVAARYPVDADHIYVSGYSYGAAMAWRYVCESGNHVAALLAIAGAIPPDENCAEAPRQARHVHGTNDTVMRAPYSPFGAGEAMALWRAKLDCGAGADGGRWQVRSFLTFNREGWECAQGAVVLDRHPGGHFVPHGWIGRQLDELLGLTPSYP